MESTSHRQDVQDVVSDLARTACEGLFLDYAVSLKPQPPQRNDGQLVFFGVVGFTGDDIKGSVVLAGSEDLIQASNPVAGSPARDWTGELTNQFVGRIKNQLLAYDVEVYITTPVVFRGDRVALEARQEVAPIAYSAESGGKVTVWVDVEASETFTLKEPNEDRAGATEGAALLF